MDSDEPQNKVKPMVIGANLDAISVSELEHLIITLDSEIVRIRSEITKKRATKAAADNLFKF